MSRRAALYRRLGLLALLVGLAAVFWWLDLGRYLTLDNLRASRQGLEEFYARRPLAFALGYALVYVLVTGLSLPGATVLSLAGGAVLGLGLGVLVVSFASSIGATLACAAARYLLRDWVRHRFGPRLQAMNQGLEREGAYYLFSLRLVPIFPFFLINLAMGLSGLRLATFYWVSQLGMLPGTLVYINAGSELGRLESLAGIVSPRLLLAFVLLGLFPLAAKKALAWRRSRQAPPPAKG